LRLLVHIIALNFSFSLHEVCIYTLRWVRLVKTRKLFVFTEIFKGNHVFTFFKHPHLVLQRRISFRRIKKYVIAREHFDSTHPRCTQVQQSCIALAYSLYRKCTRAVDCVLVGCIRTSLFVPRLHPRKCTSDALPAQQAGSHDRYNQHANVTPMLHFQQNIEITK